MTILLRRGSCQATGADSRTECSDRLRAIRHSPVPNAVIRVCSVCRPGDSVFRDFPHLKDCGAPISHGLCRFHQEALMADFESEQIKD